MTILPTRCCIDIPQSRPVKSVACLSSGASNMDQLPKLEAAIQGGKVNSSFCLAKIGVCIADSGRAAIDSNSSIRFLGSVSCTPECSTRDRTVDTAGRRLLTKTFWIRTRRAKQFTIVFCSSKCCARQYRFENEELGLTGKDVENCLRRDVLTDRHDAFTWARSSFVSIRCGPRRYDSLSMPTRRSHQTNLSRHASSCSLERRLS